MNDKTRRPDEPEDPAAGGKIDFEEIRKVIALLEEKNLSVFELEVEGFKIKITRSLPAAPPANAYTVTAASAAAAYRVEAE